MPLAILIIADEEPSPVVLGSPILELQVRRARDAGAGHAVIYAERVSPQLLVSVERLRRDGLSVDIARNAADTAELMHPEERVLLIKADVLIEARRIAYLLAEDGAAVLCVRDDGANDRFERIDATARWTGWAIVDGGLLRRTTAMVGDWDLASTLLRRAVQEGARRIVLTPLEASSEITVVAEPGEAIGTGRRLIAATVPVSAGWATHWLLAPAARRLALLASETGVEPRWVTMSAFACFGVAAMCALAGWIVASLAFVLAGHLLDLTGDVATRAASAFQPWSAFRYPVRATASSIVVLAMGTTLFLRSLQWGCVVLALIVVAATWLAARLARDDARFARWRSDPGGLALIGIAGFAVGAPIGALCVAALHAAVSLAAAVRRLASS